jgi:hypothetical protein
MIHGMKPMDAQRRTSMSARQCFRPTALSFLLVLVGLLVFRSPAFAQPAPEVLAIGLDEFGTFCGYEPSESGDNPDEVLVRSEVNTFYMYVGVETEEEADRLVAMPLGTPIMYNFWVVRYYSELGGEMYTNVFFKSFMEGEGAEPGLCGN